MTWKYQFYVIVQDFPLNNKLNYPNRHFFLFMINLMLSAFTVNNAKNKFKINIVNWIEMEWRRNKETVALMCPENKKLI